MRRALVVVAVAVGIGAVALVLKPARAPVHDNGIKAGEPRPKPVPLFPPLTASPAKVNLRVLRTLPELIRERVRAQSPAWTFTGRSSFATPASAQGIVDRFRFLDWETPVPLRLTLVLCTSDRAAEGKYRGSLMGSAVWPTRVYTTLGDTAALYGGDEHGTISGRVGPVHWSASGATPAVLQVSRYVVEVVEEQREQLAKADDD